MFTSDPIISFAIKAANLDFTRECIS